MKLTAELRAHMETDHGLAKDASEIDAKKAILAAVGSGKLSTAKLSELQKGTSAGATGKELLPEMQTGENPNTIFSGAQQEKAGMGGGGSVRVKKASEMYDTTKSRALWPDNREIRRKGEFAPGRDAFYYESVPGAPNVSLKKPIYNPSAAEQAKIGALFKACVIRDIGEETARVQLGMRMTDHDRALVNEAMHEDEWVGPTQNQDIIAPRKLHDFERKSFQTTGLKATALLGDTGGLSGGEQAVPQYFDFEAIRIPLLYGELVPYVEITPTDRGKAAHSYSIGTPTFVTTASGSAITAFTTDSFVATYDVPFFPASCGFQWGRDFEMDAAPNVGQMIVAQMGDQFKYQMDNWIAVGDGTTQPQGLNSASGGTTVSATGTSHATMVYADALNLAFGVTKPYRKAFGGDSTMYIMRDSMYKKFMTLATGVTGDTRPIYGMHLKDYQLGDYHVAIQNDIADGTVFFCNLRGYRMYRRLGLYFELITSGSTLTLANLKLLFARARFGGKITLGGYYAKMTSLQIG